MRVYVAGRSKELDRCASAMQHVIAHPGMDLTHDWVAEMRAEPTPDHSLTLPEQAKYAGRDIVGVERADLLWLLTGEGGSAGRWVELGIAIGLHKRIVVSGDPIGSIFCAVADSMHETDDFAWSYICSLLHEGRAAS